MTKSGTKKFRRQQLRDGIQQDEAEIRRYGRLLKLNRRRKTQAHLPKVFKDTGLDYLLDLVGGGDGDEGGARVAEIVKECPESAAYYETAADAVAAKKLKLKRKKSMLRSQDEAAATEDAPIQEADDGGRNDGEVKAEEVKSAATGRTKRPDIYGRDAPAVQSAAAADEAEADAALSRRMRGLVNRVSERVLGRVAADLVAAYRESARGPANRILAGLVLGVAENSGQPLSERILVDQAALVAVVSANVSGSDLGAQMAEMLVLRLGTDPEALSAHLESGGKSGHNLLLFAMFLCWLGVLSGRLPFDLLQWLADLATEQSLEALILCLRHAGLQLRRIDGARMRALLDGLQRRAEADDLAARFGEASRGAFLLELLQAVRNNNYRKIPGYDCEYVERTRKTVKQLVATESAPVEFGVADVRDAAIKGRWWVVGAAYAAPASVIPASDASVVAPTASASGPQQADSEQGRIATIAARLGLKTPQRRAIFAALVGSADADDAAGRLLRLLASTGHGGAAAGAADVASITLKCAMREARYNPFYSAVLLRLRRASRQHAMPIRCAVWDQLAALGDTRPERAARLGELAADLVLASVVPPAAVVSRFPFELVPASSSGSDSAGGAAAAACLSGLAGALRRRAGDSPELPGLLRGLVAGGEAGAGRALAAALVVVGRQRGCPDADWLLARLRTLADEA